MEDGKTFKYSEMSLEDLKKYFEALYYKGDKSPMDLIVIDAMIEEFYRHKLKPCLKMHYVEIDNN